MPMFSFICTDKPDSLELRMATRPPHVEHLNALNEKGILKMAGPFLGADGKPNGSLVIVETATIEDAQALADADPYAKAGLFEKVEVKPLNWVFNPPKA